MSGKTNALSFIVITATACLLSACTTPEDFREQSFVEMRGNQPVYKFANTVTVAPNSSKVREQTITATSMKLCTEGYKELDRTDATYRNNSYQYPIGGITIYKTDRLSTVGVTIICRGEL